MASSNHVAVAVKPARLGAISETLRQAAIALSVFVLALPRGVAQERSSPWTRFITGLAVLRNS